MQIDLIDYSKMTLIAETEDGYKLYKDGIQGYVFIPSDGDFASRIEEFGEFSGAVEFYRERTDEWEAWS